MASRRGRSRRADQRGKRRSLHPEVLGEERLWPVCGLGEAQPVKGNTVRAAESYERSLALNAGGDDAREIQEKPRGGG